MMTKTDRLAAKRALAEWLHNQHISPLDAAYILAEMAGSILAAEAGKDEQRRRDGLIILAIAMDQSK